MLLAVVYLHESDSRARGQPPAINHNALQSRLAVSHRCGRQGEREQTIYDDYESIKASWARGRGGSVRQSGAGHPTVGRSDDRKEGGCYAAAARIFYFVENYRPIAPKRATTHKQPQIDRSIANNTTSHAWAHKGRESTGA